MLLPLIATAYAFRFTGMFMHRLYLEFLDGLASSDFSSLPEMHATSAGLKALTTWTATDAIETCRRACGGHGYSRFSGLPSMYENYAPAVTFEGENTVMCFQTGRYLLKQLANARRDERILGSCSYLSDAALPAARCPAADLGDLLQPDTQLHAFRHRAARCVGTRTPCLFPLRLPARRGALTDGPTLVAAVRQHRGGHRQSH